MQKYGNLSPPPSPSPVKGEEIFDFLRDHQVWILECGMQITVDPVTVMTQSLLHWWANDDQVVTVVAVEEALGGIDDEE